MKKVHFTLGIMIFIFVHSACSVNQQAQESFGFGISSGTPLAFVGEEVNPPLSFTVFKLNSSLSAITDFSDSVQLSAYSDSNCSRTTLGTLKIGSTNPLALSQGIAQFSGITYVPPSGVYEASIYFKGDLVNHKVSTCSIAVNVIQHFNVGQGFVGFGSSGAAGANTLSSVLDSGVAHRIDSNGLYVIAGNSKNGSGQEIALWRYLPNGNLDTTFKNATSLIPGSIHFGSTGVAGASGSSEADSVVDLAIDSSGKYLVLGTSINSSSTGKELVLLRFNSDGTLDTTFASGGAFHSGAPGLTGMTPASALSEEPKAMVLDSQSRILVVGRSLNSSGYGLLLARFTSNGALDSSFATAGIYNDSGASGVAGGVAGITKNDIGYSVQIDTSNNIIVAGSSDTSSSQKKLALWKFNTNGQLDKSFGTQGVFISGATGAAGGTTTNLSDVGHSVRIDFDGKYVIAGSSKNNSGGIEMTLWRFLTSGQPDTTWNGSGSFHYGVNGGAAGANTPLDIGLSLVIDNSKKFYIVSGPSLNASGGTQTAIWKILSNGTLDPTFNTAGIALTPVQGVSLGMSASTVYDYPGSLQMDQWGTFSIVGTSKIAPNLSGQELAIWRYLSVGILDL